MRRWPWARDARNAAEESRDGEPSRPWVGIDVAEERTSQSPAALLPLVAIALGVALAIAALRIDLIKTRYAVSELLETEQALLEEQRALIVRRRQLRDPVALARQARERGFRAPDRILTLADPSARVRPPAEGGETPQLARVAQ